MKNNIFLFVLALLVSCNNQAKKIETEKSAGIWELSGDKYTLGSDEDVEIVKTKGHPIVYADKLIDKNLPTILVYGHYDVQPPDPILLWDSPPFEPLVKICKKNKIFLVEDAAQALGSKFKGKHAGTFGNASAISFYPAKVLGCFGDAGGILTNDYELFDKIKLTKK